MVSLKIGLDYNNNSNNNNNDDDDFNGTPTYNHLVRKRTRNRLAKLAK